MGFVEVFKKHGVPISMNEAREPMGLRKDFHIKAILEMPDVQKRWNDVYGRLPNQGDVDNIFKDAVPMQLEVLPKYSGLLPGTVSAVNILKDAIKQGYHPDVTVAGDDVINGTRPQPHMIYRNLDLLNIPPIQSVVKVDDTVSGIVEAHNAGCWSVGVARYSNYMDIDSFEQEEQLDEKEIARRLNVTRDILIKSGAHYVIDSIADMPEVVDDINQRLKKGERP